jgi:ankyrin repeat protein
MGHSELFQACYENNLSRVKELLDHGADPNLQEPHYGWTALIRAAYRGCTDIVRLLLLDRRTDPNLQDYDGCTALMFASIHGHIDAVRLLLLDHGADPNLQTGAGWTALNWASQWGNIDVVELLEAACWNRKIVQPLMNLGIFPEGLIREYLMI